MSQAVKVQKEVEETEKERLPVRVIYGPEFAQYMTQKNKLTEVPSTVSVLPRPSRRQEVYDLD